MAPRTACSLQTPWRWCVSRLAVAAPAVLATACMPLAGGLPAMPGMRGERTAEQAEIEHQPVCIGSSVHSAGKLSDILYYRAMATGGGLVSVGYFAFYSEERPWGNNWLTWTLLPALAIDMVYSRAFWVLPGLQRAMYGAGDVEGVSIVYARGADGTLSVDHGLADDGSHRLRQISRAELLALDPVRPTFTSDVWSHQLGGRAVGSPRDLVDDRCYADDAIRPLPDGVALAFGIDKDRAPPAHVEEVVGRRIDKTVPLRAVVARVVRAPLRD